MAIESRITDSTVLLHGFLPPLPGIAAPKRSICANCSGNMDQRDDGEGYRGQLGWSGNTWGRDIIMPPWWALAPQDHRAS